MAFTDQQLKIIAHLKTVGYGYTKFAASVEKQGWCSSKQETTLCNMYNRLMSPRQNYATREYDDISDLEAMRSGEYF